MFGRKNDTVEDIPKLPVGRATVIKKLESDYHTAKLPNVKLNSSHPITGGDMPREGQKSEEYYDIKRQLFDALIEIIDVSQLTKMSAAMARTEISNVASGIVAAKNLVMSTAEEAAMLEDICNDVLGY